jgi:hypothetical protein
LQLINNDPCQRENRISYLIERASTVRMLIHFYTTGTLLTQEALQPCSDDEYIGAAIAFCQELSRYAVNRACDVSTIPLQKLLSSLLLTH